MTWGFVASFGGVAGVFVLLFVALWLLTRESPPASRETAQTDVMASLARAEAATRQAHEEIARLRSSFARHG